MAKNRPNLTPDAKKTAERVKSRDGAENAPDARYGGNTAIPDTPPPPVPLHTPEMQDAELRELLGGRPTGGTITAGVLMALWLERNPYIAGGIPTPEADAALLRATRRDTIGGALAALDTALRPLCIIRRPDGARLPQCYDGYGPEWLADIVATAARALPSLEWSDAVWRLPLCTLGHLAGAAVRAAGGRTERPMDTTAADDWLLRANGLR